MFKCLRVSVLITLSWNLYFTTSLKLTSTDEHSSGNNTGDCDWRYLKHYETKNCTAIYEENSDRKCPKRFQCPKLNIDTEVCQLNGEIYGLDAKVNTSNPCEICYCKRDLDNGKASIQCVSVECRSVVPALSGGCYLYYERGSCCPVQKCDTSTKTVGKATTCLYNGKEYKIGQKIYSEEDPCLICRCTENWNGLNNRSCDYFNCDLEKYIHKLSKGCIPIYHDKTCCPIEYHCPSALTEDENEEPGYEGPDLCQEDALFGSCHEAFTRYYFNNRKGICEEFLFSGCKGNRNNFASPAECETVCGSSRLLIPEQRRKESACYFDHRFYEVGDILDIQHPTNCVTCACHIPPDFSCIHRSCPGPPRNDYESCQAIYKENSCCAVYNCTKVVEKAIKYSYNRDVSNCPALNCPAPLCTKIVLPNDCPECECTTHICVPPKCLKGCVVEDDVPDGRCPDCVCLPSRSPPVENALSTLSTIGACPPLNCQKASCRVIERSGQCPICECGGEYFCSKPKCESGCEVEDGVDDGCPGCRCWSTDTLKTVQQRRKLVSYARLTARQASCLTPICHPGCHIVTKNDGCLTCKCEQCIPPKCICPTSVCEEGCHLDRNVSYGQCPVCVCTRGGLVGLRGRCQVPVCNAANCKLVSEEDGCLKCKCDDLCLPPRCFCSKPSCNDGCEIDTDVRDGRCPGCKCKPSSFVASAPRPTPPKALCPASRGCDAPNCELTLNQEGCAYCECKSGKRSCTVESCPSNCELEMHPSNGECPVCVCKDDDEREYETISRQNSESSGGNSDRRVERCPTLYCADCSTTTDSHGCRQCDCSGPTSQPAIPRPVVRRPNPVVTTSSTTVPACPEEVCQGPFCRSVLGDDGCPTCQCANPAETMSCTRPECPSTCALKNKPGECPVCTCPTRSPPLDRSNSGSGSGRHPVRTCPSESCHGIKCKLIPGDNGCQKCVCEEPCRRVTCERRCTKIENPGNGKCPYCLCNF